MNPATQLLHLRGLGWQGVTTRCGDQYQMTLTLDGDTRQFYGCTPRVVVARAYASIVGPQSELEAAQDILAGHSRHSQSEAALRAARAVVEAQEAAVRG